MRLAETCCTAALAALLLTGPAAAQTPEPAAPGPARTLTASRQRQFRFGTFGFVQVIPKKRRRRGLQYRRYADADTRVAPPFGHRWQAPPPGALRRVIGQDEFEVQTSRLGRLTGAQLPVMELHVPQNAIVAVGGAVRLHVAPAQAAHIRLDGCGDAEVARVAGEAEIAIAGSQDLRLVEAGSAEVAIAGSGDVTIGVVRDGLNVSVAGSGDVVAGRVDGPTSIAVQGSGDVTIRDGRATSLSVVIAGSGNRARRVSANSRCCNLGRRRRARTSCRRRNQP
jgi:hypothetical protein